MANVLIIDDNDTMREGLSAVVRRMGHKVLAMASGAEAIAAFAKQPADFVMTDLKMSGLDGLAVLRRIRELDPDCPTLLMSAYGSVEVAVEAMKLGAMDFLTKPFAPEVVRLKVERGLELRAARRLSERLSAENEHLRDGQGRHFDMIGATEPMRRVQEAITRVAKTDAAVAISGESGTGKELVARAIHNLSRRSQGPFIKVNCGALAETLLESELFGHERGAFTGAVKRRLGRIELADRGTLFLDEIGEISPAMQVRLLRVLQEGTFERVGGEETIKADLRVISATHRDLHKLIAEGKFREDLFYRLQVVPIAVPPLRERRADIPELCRHFIAKLAPRTNPAVQSLSDEALALLLAYPFPGNVRELINVIEQSLVFADGPTLLATALPPNIRGRDDKAASSDSGLAIPGGLDGAIALPEILDDLEKQLILKAFRQAKGVKTETARLLGIKPSALYYKLEKYGIE